MGALSNRAIMMHARTYRSHDRRLSCMKSAEYNDTKKKRCLRKALAGGTVIGWLQVPLQCTEGDSTATNRGLRS